MNKDRASSNWQVILELGGEGGSITLLGAQGEDGSWAFVLRTNEAGVFDLLSEEDQIGISPVSERPPVFSWPEALARWKVWIVILPRSSRNSSEFPGPHSRRSSTSRR
jgi:hypothetical protein